MSPRIISLVKSLFSKKIRLFKWEIHILIPISIISLIVIIFLPFAKAENELNWSQTSWDGGQYDGVVTGQVTTYKSKYQTDVGTSGEIKLEMLDSWYNTNWSYRKKINFDNTLANLGITTENLVNFVVLLKLNSNNIDYSKTLDQGQDIRFTDPDGTLLPHEIEKWDETGNSFVWVKVPQIDQNSNADYIYIYYNNPLANDGQTPLTVWGNEYSMVYHFYEPAGTTGNGSVHDSTGNTSGTPSAGTVFGQSGQIGDTANFSSGTGITTGTLGSPPLTVPTTISYWINTANYASPSRQNPFNQAYGGWGTMTLEPNGVISWFFGSNGGDNSPYTANQSLVLVNQNNTWIFVTGVRNPADFTFKWYKNGTFLNSSTYPNTYPVTTSRLFTIGDGYVSPINGRIDEFRVGKTAQTAAWIAAMYHNDIDDFASYQNSETKYKTNGYLVSNVFDSNYLSDWKTLSYTNEGSGTTIVKVRSDNTPSMENAPDFATCSNIPSGTALNTTSCVQDKERYIQYYIELQTTTENTPVFKDINIQYKASDQTPPTQNATDIYISNLDDENWTNNEVTINWTAGFDDPEGGGLLGYCISLDEAVIGNSNLLNPSTTAGKLHSLDDGISAEYCDFIAAGTSLNLSQINGLTLTTNRQYYFSIKAVDMAGNIWNGPSEEYQDLISFKYDRTEPENPSYLSLPGNFISTKNVSVIWPIIGEDGPNDNESGLLGLQYKIGTDGIWYGDLHLGTEDKNDLLTNDGSYTMDENTDYPVLQEGSNFIYMRTFDIAGNISSTYTLGVLKLNTIAPSIVQNLIVDPENNTTNSYSFSWDPPETYIGQLQSITYCYTINIIPSIEGCNFTQPGITQLLSDAYATQPGTNTIYLVAKDEAGNINYENYSNVQFIYSGSAPGLPRNIDIADISIKATSNWRLALTWDIPENTGAGVSGYKVYRNNSESSCSSNYSLFDLVGTTSGTSYVDVNLNQMTYYYCVKACDSANNCGAVSTTVDEYPTGKFTEPAKLLSGPDVSLLTTKRAVINWVTERDSDSRIQYGTSSGNYYSEEVAKSDQTITHTLTLNNLKAGTTYYYRARWIDEDGNIGVSDEKTFLTDPAPIVQDISITSVGINFALVKFTTIDSSKIKLYYGQSNTFGGVSETGTSTEESTYTIQIEDLEDGTKYFYKINPFDIEGEEYEGSVLSFETLPRPSVGNIQIEEKKNTSQPTINVIWTSNTDISSIITYYPINNEDNKIDIANVELVKDHSIEVTNLLPETEYLLVVKGSDKLGNIAESSPQTFTTATDSRPPEISNSKVEGMILSSTSVNEDSKAQLIVSWDTDEDAGGLVEYGEGTGSVYSNSTQQDENLTRNHVVIISNLKPASVYHIKIVTFDKADNQTKSNDIVTTTPKSSENIIDLLFGTLLDIFSFLR